MARKKYHIIILLILITAIASCNRYIDKISDSNTHSVKQGNFEFYRDRNVLLYTSNMILRSDKDVKYPKSFEVVLPKGIKYYEFAGSTEFKVFYEKKQAVFIKLYLEADRIQQDTLYSPKKEDLEILLQNTINFSGSKYDINSNDFIENRKHLVVKHNAATILLYNIKPEKFDLFYNSISKFNLINKSDINK